MSKQDEEVFAAALHRFEAMLTKQGSKRHYRMPQVATWSWNNINEANKEETQ